MCSHLLAGHIIRYTCNVDTSALANIQPELSIHMFFFPSFVTLHIRYCSEIRTLFHNLFCFTRLGRCGKYCLNSLIRDPVAYVRLRFVLLLGNILFPLITDIHSIGYLGYDQVKKKKEWEHVLQYDKSGIKRWTWSVLQKKVLRNCQWRHRYINFDSTFIT